MKLEIEKGSVYGNFRVVKELPKKILPSGQTNRIFLCHCICGNNKEIRLVHLVRCKIHSCGCLNKYKPNRNKKDIYIRKVWRSVKYRTQQNYKERHLYYDRGITMCTEWKSDYSTFYKWAILNGLRKGMQIDRTDNNKGYSSDNCRVVTHRQNINNRNVTFKVSYGNRIVPFMDIIREKGLLNNAPAIRGRLKRGWDGKKAIDTPIKKGNYKRKI